MQLIIRNLSRHTEFYCLFNSAASFLQENIHLRSEGPGHLLEFQTGWNIPLLLKWSGKQSFRKADFLKEESCL